MDVKLLYWVDLNDKIGSQNILPSSVVRAQKHNAFRLLTIELTESLKDDLKYNFNVSGYSQNLYSLTRDLLQLVVYGIRISILY